MSCDEANSKKNDESSGADDIIVCINCMCAVDSLYTSYSRDVIRITECKNCLKPVDKYVEFDVVLVLIDLILQYAAAYRHLLLNTKFKDHRRLVLLFVLCNAYEKWIERRASELPTVDGIYHIELQFYQSLAQSIAEIVSYTLAICALLRVINWMAGVPQRLPPLFAAKTMMGFYGNIFVVFSIIWKLHHHWSYRCLTQLFLVISHVQVQRTLVPFIHWAANFGIVLFGLVVQQLFGWLIQQAFQMIS